MAASIATLPGAQTVAAPFVIAIAFLLIADIHAPRRGLIHVRPPNLEALVELFGR